MLKGMENKNVQKVPSVKHVLSEGNWLETAGIIILGLGIIGGIIGSFATGTPAFFLISPAGLLLMITGYVKKIAAASTAQYILQLHVNGVAEEPTSPQA